MSNQPILINVPRCPCRIVFFLVCVWVSIRLDYTQNFNS